jgi:hypothetical protein
MSASTKTRRNARRRGGVSTARGNSPIAVDRIRAKSAGSVWVPFVKAYVEHKPKTYKPFSKTR